MNISSNGIELEVEASPPAHVRSPLFVLSHPHPKMGGDMHNKVIDQLFRRSKDKGWGVVRFNFRGVGASGGQYDHGNGEVEDLFSVLHWASAEFKRPVSHFSLVGYSFGSWITAKASARLTEIQKVILIAPPVKLMDFSPFDNVKHSKFVFAAEKDEIISIEETEKWFANLLPPKTIQVIQEADHSKGFKSDRRIMLRVSC